MLDYVDGSLEHMWTSQTFTALKLLDWTQPDYPCSKASGLDPARLPLLYSIWIGPGYTCPIAYGLDSAGLNLPCSFWIGPSQPIPDL